MTNVVITAVARTAIGSCRTWLKAALPIKAGMTVATPGRGDHEPGLGTLDVGVGPGLPLRFGRER